MENFPHSSLLPFIRQLYETTCGDSGNSVTPPSLLAPQTSNIQGWAMFDGSSWPSDQQLASIAQICRSTPYRLGPSARQTAILETAVQNIKTVLTKKLHQRRTIVVMPVGSADINAWTINAENVWWYNRQAPRAGEEGSLVCVPQGVIDFFLDAPNELEAVVAHEIGHAVDIPCYLDVRPKDLVFHYVQQSCESRADAFALNVFIAQGKNAYAVGGAFGRLQMYSGDTSTSLFARLNNLGNDHPITPDRIRALRRMLLEAFRTRQLQPLPPINR